MLLYSQVYAKQSQVTNKYCHPSLQREFSHPRAHQTAQAVRAQTKPMILSYHGRAWLTRSLFAMLEKNAQKDSRFKVLRLAKNVGCDGGIAAGMAHTSGDACVILMGRSAGTNRLDYQVLFKWRVAMR